MEISYLIKIILFLVGLISLGLGIMGIFLPLLPTTPFLLLATACFIRSSEKVYNWLIHRSWFGNYIKNYIEGNGIPLKTKLVTLFFLWSTIGYSAIFIVSHIFIRVLLVIIALSVTIHIIHLKTLK